MSLGHRPSARAARLAYALLLAATAAFAQTPAADPNVDAVVQAGRWHEDGAGDGVYRIVVVTQGFEHVSSRVVAEWKADGDESGNAKVVHTAELVAPGMYSVGTPTVTATESGVRVDITGAATYAPETNVTCRFDLAPGGKSTVVRACGG
jgi:hypothetical protein